MSFQFLSTLPKTLRQCRFLASSAPPTRFLNPNKLTKERISAVARGEIGGLVIHNYYPKELCKTTSAKILSKEGYINKITSAKILSKEGYMSKIAVAYCETIGAPELRELYYQQAPSLQKYTRSLFAPYIPPMDQLYLDCNEVWPGGAQLLNLGRGRMLSCLPPRVISDQVLPHEDKIERENEKQPYGYVSQLAAKIYLQKPDQGGSFVFWNTSLETDEYNKLCEGKEGIPFDSLEPPAIEIAPNTGDLIIWNSRNLHGVSPIKDGKEVSVSTSIIYSGASHKPLRFWS
ncbi:MAG: hypothetical protein SP4CHLAM17_10230 [Chlamydiales bacterium]|nr:hypothetical protein [Chlamydiales bacterium]